MGQLTAILPATDVSAIITALDTTADQARAAGDDRTRAQVVADTLVQRLGGLSTTSTGVPTAVALKVVVSAETLLGTSDEPGYVHGAGHIPATLARQLATNGAQHLRSTLQRLFAMPHTGALIATESTSSYFRHGLADLVDLRDRRCRTPYCNAPIRHHDHVVARARRRPHHPRQRPRPLRGLQLRQGDPRLAPPARPGPPRRHRHHHHHPHRTPPPLPRPRRHPSPDPTLTRRTTRPRQAAAPRGLNAAPDRGTFGTFASCARRPGTPRLEPRSVQGGATDG